MERLIYDDKTQKFKSLLDQEHQWPTDYLFKFIVPQEKEQEVSSLFPDHQLKIRPSRKGKYVCVSVSVYAESADLIIAIYEKAAKINGLISL